jgi:NAD(P)-dependent dehydrogenase (short-subunit alcohol dehydrogenase family)
MSSDSELPLRFKDKVAVITGASLYGIGGAVALRLAREGAAIHLITRDEPGELLSQLSEYRAGASWTQSDVTNQSDIDRACDECLATYEKVDVLINNAGIDSINPFGELTDETWQTILNVNLTGVMRVTRALLPELEKTKGAIVNISSSSAMGGTAGLVAYSASKGGVNGLTQSLALELAKKKVRVVGVAPALIRTPMARKYVDDVLTAEKWEKMQDCHPLGIGKAEDVAAAVAFLASDEAKWISGVTLPLGWMPTYPMPLLD